MLFHRGPHWLCHCVCLHGYTKVALLQFLTESQISIYFHQEKVVLVINSTMHVVCIGYFYCFLTGKCCRLHVSNGESKVIARTSRKILTKIFLRRNMCFFTRKSWFRVNCRFIKSRINEKTALHPTSFLFCSF